MLMSCEVGSRPLEVRRNVTCQAQAKSVICRSNAPLVKTQESRIRPALCSVWKARVNPLGFAGTHRRRLRCKAPVTSGRGTSPDGPTTPTNSDTSKASSGLGIPTILTLLRVAVIPVLVVVYFLPGAWVPSACAGMFVAAAITDFLDGYLARKWNETSDFGAFLDPVADKLMVTAALLLLCTKFPTGPAMQYPLLLPVAALVIISREITVSAVREWAATAGGDAQKAVKVNSIGKWKTATQMIALTLLLLLRDAQEATGIVVVGQMAGAGLLFIATVLTIWSLWVYMSGLLKYMK
eukprot:CAMPEP_0118932204 /NCGR_PEP_ID=MMETSP1169-20130426/9475_1 /TAXON_ID=36882 /ORGANISM="Pyramimonas obovata, Strain CCMP722" /LENGTH=294 /DNA_ID=CAMNT_0006874827 /DNA_START=162 /DNA_END=1046 /DNA_ORIENTATION=+